MNRKKQKVASFNFCDMLNFGRWFEKVTLQTAFIISVCNNQLLDLIENQLVRVLGLIPGVASFLPNIISKLHIAREKYMAASAPVSSVKVLHLTHKERKINVDVILTVLCMFFF